MNTPQQVIQSLLANGHTQVELAKTAKVSQMTISRWASGKTKKIDAQCLDRLRRKFTEKKAKK